MIDDLIADTFGTVPQGGVKLFAKAGDGTFANIASTNIGETITQSGFTTGLFASDGLNVNWGADAIIEIRLPDGHAASPVEFTTGWSAATGPEKHWGMVAPYGQQYRLVEIVELPGGAGKKYIVEVVDQ